MVHLNEKSSSLIIFRQKHVTQEEHNNREDANWPKEPLRELQRQELEELVILEELAITQTQQTQIQEHSIRNEEQIMSLREVGPLSKERGLQE